MPLRLDDLVENYSSALEEGSAALFIGAGMSLFHFPDWQEFMRPFAQQVGLEIDETTDLVAVAQYYLNSKNGERSFLGQALLDEFDRREKPTESHYIITQLPVSAIWTTNYDQLIEHAFRDAGKYLDLKVRDQDIAFRRKHCQAVLYKMHGDISQPDRIIFAKEDYERYPRTHPVFQYTLTTNLLRKTFLFLGLGFRDPNLAYVLGHLRLLLENTKRVHYALMRRERIKGTFNASKTFFEFKESWSSFEMRTRKQTELVADLQRYGIDTYLFVLDEDVPKVLKEIQRRYRIHRLVTDFAQRYPAISKRKLKTIIYKAFNIHY